MATKSRNAIIVVIGVSFFIIFKGYNSGHFSVESSKLEINEKDSSRKNKFSKKDSFEKEESRRKPSSFLHQESRVVRENKASSEASDTETRIGHNHEECLESLRYAQENMEREKLSAEELAELERQMKIEHEQWQEEAKAEFEEYVFTEDGEKKSKAELEEDFLEEIQRIEESNDSLEFEDMEI